MATLPTLHGASPLEADDASRLLFTTGTTETLTRALDNVPGDFLSMNTGLTWTVQERNNLNGGDDDLTLAIRIMNGTTVLAAADSGGTFQTVIAKTGGVVSDTNRGPTAFGFVNTTADAATWNGASIELRQTYSQQMGPDNLRFEVDIVSINGEYTQTGPQTVQRTFTGSITPAGALLLGGLPQIANAKDIEWGGKIEQAASGALYTVTGLEGATRNYELMLHKSTDGGLTWDQTHVFTAPNGATDYGNDTSLVYHQAHLDANDILHIVWSPNPDAGTNNDIVYAAWDCSNDTVEHAPEVVAGDAVFNYPMGIRTRSGSPSEVLILVRSDTNTLDLYRGNAGGWTAHTAIDSEVANDVRGLTIIVDSNDDAHCLWTDTVVGGHHRVLLANNTLTTTQQNAFTTSELGLWPTGSAYEFDGALHFVASYSANNVDPAVISSNGIGASPTWTNNQLTAANMDRATGGNVGTTLTVVNSKMFVAWIDEGDQQPRWAEWNTATDAWGAVNTVTSPPTMAEESDMQMFGTVDGADIYFLWAHLTVQTAITRTFDRNLYPAGTNFQRSMSGTISAGNLTGALARSTAKTLVGAATPAGEAIKSIAKTIAGSLTPTGARAARAAKTIAGAITPAGALATVKQKLITLTGSITPAAELVRSTAKTLTGSAATTGTLLRTAALAFQASTSPTGALTRSAQKALSGDVSPTGAYGPTTTRKALTGSLSPTGALLRAVQKVLAGTIGPAATRTGKTLKRLAGTITPTGDSTHEIPTGTIQRTFTGALNTTGDFLITVGKTLSGSTTPTATLTRSTAKTLSGNVTPAGALATTVKILISLAGSINPTATLTRTTRKLVAGTISPAATRAGKALKTFAGTLTTSGETAAQVIGPGAISVAGVLNTTGDLLIKVGKTLAGSTTPAGAYGPTTARKTLAGSTTPTGALQTARTIVIALSGAITAATGTLARKTAKTITGTASPTATLVKTTAKTITATITPSGSTRRTIRINISAAITLAGTVATQIFATLAGSVSKIIRGQGGARGIRHQGKTTRSIR